MLYVYHCSSLINNSSRKSYVKNVYLLYTMQYVLEDGNMQTFTGNSQIVVFTECIHLY